jgi:hypothetical protein
MRRSVRLVPGLLASLVAEGALERPARAELTVRFDSARGQQFAQQAGVDVGALEAQVRRELESAFQIARLDEYVRAFGDAQAFTTRGLGVDYASNLRFLMIGAAANVSINAEKGFAQKEGRTRPPVSGLSTTGTVMAGLNLGLVGLRPVTIFGNYFKGSGSWDEFDSQLENRGLHVQLKLFGPADASSLLHALFKWGGIDITTGFDYARQRLTLADRRTLRTTVPVDAAGGQDVRVAVDGTGVFALEMDTWSVPLELTTNVRVLYLLSLYGGLGFDWQFGGGSKLDMQLDGTMTGLAQGVSQELGTVSIRATEEATPSAGRLRGLLGAQLNVSLVKLFAQLNFVPDPASASVAFGARIAY